MPDKREASASPPATIIINGVTWDLKFMTKLELFDDSELHLLGQCKNTQAQIQIRDDIPASKQRAVAFHELFHAIETDAGLDLKETHVRALAGGLFSALRANPALAAWLLET